MKTHKAKLSKKDKSLLGYLNRRVERSEKQPINSITFIDRSGGKTIQKVSPKFLECKSNDQIVDDLFSITKDMCASRIII